MGVACSDSVLKQVYHNICHADMGAAGWGLDPLQGSSILNHIFDRMLCNGGGGGGGLLSGCGSTRSLPPSWMLNILIIFSL